MNQNVKQKFDAYPESARESLLMILTIAKEEQLGPVTESLKWGEPSYCVKGGSAVRMDWKEKSPNQFSVYFHCKTILVDTFKELYKNELVFEGNRALVFFCDHELHKTALGHCLSLALKYHQLKHLPMLGV